MLISKSSVVTDELSLIIGASVALRHELYVNQFFRIKYVGSYKIFSIFDQNMVLIKYFRLKYVSIEFFSRIYFR